MSTHRRGDDDGVPASWRRFWEFESDSNGIRIERYRDGERLVIRADLPGIDPERDDIEVAVTNRALQISAERRPPDGPVDDYQSEIRYGTFERDIILPEGASDRDIRAAYHHGVLEVVLQVPAAEHDQARVIPISFT